MRNKDTNAGFTLVELAVVLGIIGLIVGGIMTGQSLLFLQRLRSLGGDAVQYATATQLFRQQYEYYPGDKPNAQTIWGNAEGGAVTTDCVAPSTAASVGNTTCNGDGNGIIGGSTRTDEYYRAWQQLSAAGLIKGSYSGILNALVIDGVNAPKTAFDQATFTYSSPGLIDNASSASTTYFDGDYNNAMFLGLINISIANKPLLRPKDAFDMDRKMDDGLPGLGQIHTYKNTAASPPVSNCTTGTTETTAVYNKSYTLRACSLIFMSGFASKTLR